MLSTQEHEEVSYSTYSRVLNQNNISFHRPKKDQCALCMICEKSDTLDLEMTMKYSCHLKEKTAVRDLKARCKQKCAAEEDYSCAVFDLQQVIYLPASNHSALFYKRRFSNYNLTVYNIGNKDCHCYLWNEAVSKRGSSEVGTVLYNFLLNEDAKGKTTVDLFSDGCPGQNKNTIIAGMLLYAVQQCKSITSIQLNFFEAYHGQSEGDSAHSAISYAIKKAGDINVPSQLVPIIRMARRSQPYIVNRLNTEDFLDFKQLSQTMRLLNSKTDDLGKAIQWAEMRVFRVDKYFDDKIFFKTSHLQQDYHSITLRLRGSVSDLVVAPLNNSAPRLKKEKYLDLVSMCKGPLPVVSDPHDAKFYLDLPHEEE